MVVLLVASTWLVGEFVACTLQTVENQVVVKAELFSLLEDWLWHPIGHLEFPCGKRFLSIFFLGIMGSESLGSFGDCFEENSGPFEDYHCPSHSKKGGWSLVVFIWCIFLEGLGVWFGSLVVLCSDNFLVLPSFSFSSFNLYRKDYPILLCNPWPFYSIFPLSKILKKWKKNMHVLLATWLSSIDFNSSLGVVINTAISTVQYYYKFWDLLLFAWIYL